MTGVGRNSPLLPGAALWAPCLEHEVTAVAQGAMNAAERRAPFIVGQEHLGNVARHHRDIGIEIRQCDRVTMEPGHRRRA
jgi:hypothetical protein